MTTCKCDADKETNHKNLPENCKPFDLQAALAGAPVQSMDGRKVIELKYFEKIIGSYPLHVLFADNLDELETYKADGVYDKYNSEPAKNLCMAPEMINVWARLDNHVENFGQARAHIRTTHLYLNESAAGAPEKDEFVMSFQIPKDKIRCVI